MAEEKLEEINLGSDPQEPRPISISSRLSEKEKSELILLLKEFKTVFAWGYSENARIGSWANSAYIECRPRGQASGLACKVFHTACQGIPC